jgi:hypothetical protein
MALGKEFSMDFDSHDFLTPDIELPSQFFQGRAEKRPEVELLVAIFHDAINCILETRKSYKRHHFDTIEWFESTQRDHP